MVLTNISTPTRTPDTDNDTPPHAQPIRPISFANGSSKDHHYHYHQPPPDAAVTYKECHKNHAANIGGHALDGCGEFMPSPTATHTDPATLTCAACGCHRNFHRRVIEEYPPFMAHMTPHFLDFRQSRRVPSSPSPPPPPSLVPQPPTILPYPPPPQMLQAINTTAQDDQQAQYHQYPVAKPVTQRNAKAAEHNLSGRKRFRTKFSQEQKGKMHSFAERLGWKMHKCDQSVVENFCNEIGVARKVLKVWMHNNKNTFGGRKDNTSTPTSNPSNIANSNEENIKVEINGGVSTPENGYNMNRSVTNDGDEDNNDESGDHEMANGNGSSSSS